MSERRRQETRAAMEFVGLVILLFLAFVLWSLFLGIMK